MSGPSILDSVLVANRGEIACRVLRTARQLGMRSVAVYSDADEGSLHVEMADEAVHIGGSRAAESYLDGARIVDAAKRTGVQSIHPGYGFLAENADFAQMVLNAGLVWVGPSPEVIRAMGDKAQARREMAALGFPVNAGSDGPLTDVEQAKRVAAEIGTPLMVKAVAGGGGIGMRIVKDAAQLEQMIESTSTQAERSFGDGAVLLEKYLANARHVEIQILGLHDGRVAVLGERDCSVQRRFQKVIEETPSPGIDDTLREQMFSAAQKAAEALGYRNAGTVECLVSEGEFVFLEVNARLQVEHPITEMVTGVDLVAEQFRVAAGVLALGGECRPPRKGHAIELRVYAEDPRRFFPSPGTITKWQAPTGKHVRVDSGFRAGDEITPFYDPLIAKLVVWGIDRPAALEDARRAVADFVIEGVKTNLPFLTEVLDDDQFTSGEYDTHLVDRLRS